MTYTYSVFKIFNLNQSLDSKFLCPTAYYITTLVCVISLNITGQIRTYLNIVITPILCNPAHLLFKLFYVFKSKLLKSYMTSLHSSTPTFWPLASQNTFKSTQRIPFLFSHHIHFNLFGLRQLYLLPGLFEIVS